MQTLEEVYEDIREEPAFQYLRAGKQRLVPGEGNADNPRVFIIGEAPGAEESMLLRPFVGKAGRLLRELMACAGLCADNRRVWRDRIDAEGVPTTPNVWLTNAIKYRPHRNRRPARAEMAAARAYIINEWEAVNSPPVIIAVGVTAAWVSGHPDLPRNTPTRGKRSGTWIWHMYHTSYILRQIDAYKQKGEEAANAYQEAIEGQWFGLGEWLRENNY